MLAAAVESLLERGIQASPRAQALVESLRGSPLRIEPLHLPWHLAVEAVGGTLSLSVPEAGAAAMEAAPAAVVIRGTPLKLLGLAGEDAEALIRRGEVAIEGDAERAAQWRELATLLRPDLEELLSGWIGDVPAHHAGRVARGAAGWVAEALRTAGDNLGEYLAHERRTLLTRAEAQAFLDGVDQLRERVDRLQARIEALQSQSQAGAP